MIKLYRFIIFIIIIILCRHKFNYLSYLNSVKKNMLVIWFLSLLYLYHITLSVILLIHIVNLTNCPLFKNKKTEHLILISRYPDALNVQYP